MTQLKTVLGRAAWEKVAIKENDEPLVELVNTKKLRIGGINKSYKPLFLVRRSVAEKLYRAAEMLPDGFVLIVIEGFRTMESQQEEWDRVWKIIQTQNPKFSSDEVEREVRLLVAKPHLLANHHCGGAVDVTLGYEDGTLVDMGTPYISMMKEDGCRNKIPMLSPQISDEAAEFRNMLRSVMVKQGFVWYPGEWWHYCYGDRMWAVYLNKTECFYGPIEEL